MINIMNDNDLAINSNKFRIDPLVRSLYQLNSCIKNFIGKFSGLAITNQLAQSIQHELSEEIFNYANFHGVNFNFRDLTIKYNYSDFDPFQSYVPYSSSYQHRGSSNGFEVTLSSEFKQNLRQIDSWQIFEKQIVLKLEDNIVSFLSKLGHSFSNEPLQCIKCNQRFSSSYDDENDIGAFSDTDDINKGFGAIYHLSQSDVVQANKKNFICSKLKCFI
jgi:hypothetical protein